MNIYWIADEYLAERIIKGDLKRGEVGRIGLAVDVDHLVSILFVEKAQRFGQLGVSVFHITIKPHIKVSGADETNPVFIIKDLGLFGNGRNDITR